MRAVVCETWGGPELLRIKELPSPVPKAGQVLIKVHAAGVNFPDTLIIRDLYQLKPDLPFTPGSEVGGEIISVGPGVEGFRPGDRVIGLCVLGGYAEEVVAEAKLTLPIPDYLSYEVAAGLMMAYATSWLGVRDRGAVKPGETLLVLGASGGVGLAAVEIGKAVGARVVAAASSDEKLAICTAHGADAVINYSTEELRAAIKRTCPAGLDVILDPVGGAYTEAAFRSIAWRGRLLIVGFTAGSVPSIAMNLPLLKNASIIGVMYGGFPQREPEAHAACAAELFGWIAEGKISPLISKSYSLDEASDALRVMASRTVQGKIVLKMV
jgi:NADPH2:quinone reductase